MDIPLTLGVDLSEIFSFTALAALATLALLEIVLGIDNVVFLAILTDKLPEKKRPRIRTIGLLMAGGMRLVLLALAWVIVQLEQALFTIPFITEHIADPESGRMIEQAVAISIKDLVLLLGGLFLMAKAVWEIHHLVEGAGHELDQGRAGATVASVLVQVLLLDLVFSIDSVLTAVGMTDLYWVMASAVVIAVAVMLLFAGPISRFVSKHPTVKTLALAFLVLIGMLLVAEGLHQHFDRRYVYFAMGFALIVELLNLRAQAKRKKQAAQETDESA